MFLDQKIKLVGLVDYFDIHNIATAWVMANRQLLQS